MPLDTPRSLNRRNFKGLKLNAAAVSTARPPVVPAPTENDLMVGVEIDLHVHPSDLETLSQLGFGNGGLVTKVRHRPTGLLMARKTIALEANPQVMRLIRRELQTLRMCDSDFIVRYYGQSVEESSVIMYMEYMDAGSLDKIYKRAGSLPEPILAGVNAAVVDGLKYLKDLNITHRDIKPSNILVNHRGEIKLCDLGVSGTLSNSIAETFVGTSFYMAPERIEGQQYSATGDVWSLGLTLVELASGRFPFTMDDTSESGQPIAIPIFDLLDRIVNDPPPQLPSHCSRPFKDYVTKCLQPRQERRLQVKELDRQPFYMLGRLHPSKITEWAQGLPLV